MYNLIHIKVVWATALKYVEILSFLQLYVSHPSQNAMYKPLLNNRSKYVQKYVIIYNITTEIKY